MKTLTLPKDRSDLCFWEVMSKPLDVMPERSAFVCLAALGQPDSNKCDLSHTNSAL